MPTATQIQEWLQACFDKKEISYELVDTNLTLKAQFPLDCKLKHFNAFFVCRDDSYTVNSYIALNADEDSRQRVAEYITRANYGLRFGNFEMDYTDGETRFRMTVDCEDRDSLSDGMIMSSIILPMRMYERYGDGLVAVMYGFLTPEAAIVEAEKDRE